MTRTVLYSVLLLIASLLASVGIDNSGFNYSYQSTQPLNLLRNPDANQSLNHWKGIGEASVEQSQDGNSHFVVRNRGYFYQDIVLPQQAAGRYALLIGHLSSERINADGAITGLPYLYGCMMESPNSIGGRILAYLQDQQMLCTAKSMNEWATAWGVFQVPDGARAIRFYLKQAERKDVPQNGSAARFDDLGLHLFKTEDEARAYIELYEQQKY